MRLQYFFENIRVILRINSRTRSLSYFANIFSHFNDLNMQGMYANHILCTEKIEVFKKKLALWKRGVEGGSVENFPIIKKIWESDNQPNGFRKYCYSSVAP